MDVDGGAGSRREVEDSKPYTVRMGTVEEGEEVVEAKWERAAQWEMRKQGLRLMIRLAPSLPGVSEQPEQELEAWWQEARIGVEVREKGVWRLAQELGKVGRSHERLVNALHGRRMVVRASDKGGGICILSQGIECIVVRREHVKDEAV